MNRTKTTTSRILAGILTMVMLLALMPGFTLPTQAASAGISNDSLSVTIGDLGQIEVLNIVNNPANSSGNQVNFVLPNNTSPQNGVQHQWMGEMIFSTRSADTIDGLTGDFVEVDTNKTLAEGGSTTYSNASSNLNSNPYINKTEVGDKNVGIDFFGEDIDSTADCAREGVDVKTTF